MEKQFETLPTVQIVQYCVHISLLVNDSNYR